jgi:hypothetical protein
MPVPRGIPNRPDSFAKVDELSDKAYRLALPFLERLVVQGPGFYGDQPEFFTTPEARPVSPGEVHL